MSDVPKHLVRTGELEPAEAVVIRHPLNPNSEVALQRLAERTGMGRVIVTLARVPPGKESFVLHVHLQHEEFVYILEGECILVTDAGETPMKAGMCAGFRAGTGDAHHLVNRGGPDCVYLEIGDRTLFESVDYPDDDLMVRPGPDGKSVYFRKDGKPVF